MGSPNITLSIDDGPKKGERLDRCHGNVIRIGRVVRGNTIAIKDPSISQKHLTVTFLSDICQWAVTDIGSANGTIVNGVVICPNVPVPLADGDIIKIGQSTFMSVKISAFPLAPEPRTRRGRRITAALAVQMEEKVEDNEMEEVANHGGKGKPRGEFCSGTASNSSKVETLVPMRALTMVCSATRPMEQIGFEDNADEPAKIGDKVRGRRKRGRTCAGSTKDGQTLDAMVVELNTASLTKVNNSIKDVALVPMAERGKKGRSARASTLADCSARYSKEQFEIEKNLEEPAKNGGKERAWRKKGSVSAGTSKNDQSFDFMVVEENGGRKMRVRATSARVSKEKDEVKVDGPTKKGGKGNTHSKRGIEPAGFSRNFEFLEPVDTKVLEEELEIKEKVGDMAKDGLKGRVRGKRGLGSARVSRKGEVLESLVVQLQQGRVTRSSKNVMEKSTLVSKELEEEKENKVVEVQEAAKNGRNQKEKAKQGVRFDMISRKDEDSKPVACSGILFKDLHGNQVEDKVNMDSEALEMEWKKKLTVEHNFGCLGQKLAEEVENNVDNMISSESNSGEEKYFPENYSWSSFSIVRGIPNTTSKYREDKLINFHATPFEVRIERALKRGTSVQI